MKNYLKKLVLQTYKEDGEDFFGLPYYLDIEELPNVDDESIDFENFEWLEITDDKLIVCCGGDWQDSLTLTIELIDNKLLVTNSVGGFKDGLSEDEFNLLLFGTFEYDEILSPKQIKNVEMDIGGLQCDNPTCDWVDMSISVEDYEEWVNGKCPICGEIVLTEDEYNQTKKLLLSVDMINNLSVEELQQFNDNLSPEEIDKALDWMNDMGMKKITGIGDEELWKATIYDKKRDNK
jgi:hypothetical protein